MRPVMLKRWRVPGVLMRNELEQTEVCNGAFLVNLLQLRIFSSHRDEQNTYIQSIIMHDKIVSFAFIGIPSLTITGGLYACIYTIQA